MDYDNMLTKMNLRYLNGKLYKNEVENVIVEQKETKEEYLRRMYEKQLERKYIQQQQKEKRKLLISKINATPNKLFQMNLS